MCITTGYHQKVYSWIHMLVIQLIMEGLLIVKMAMASGSLPSQSLKPV